MSRLTAQAADLLRQRQERARRGEEIRPLAASGLPDASAVYGGGFETTINPFTGGTLTPVGSDAPQGNLAPLLSSKEGQDAREVRVDPASGVQGSSGGFATSIRAGEGSAANAAQARQLLRTGQFQDAAHKARLENIIVTSEETERTNARLATKDNAAERKRQQQLSDFQWKALVTAGADPRNPMSVAEFDQAAAEIQRNALAGSLPNPNQLRKRNEEADDPALDVTNTAKAWAEQFGLPEEQIGSFFGQPANGKFYTQAEKKSAFDMARQAADQDPSTGKVSAVARQLSRVDKQIEDFRKRSVRLFDDNGVQKDRPGDGFLFGADPEEQRLYDEEVKKLEALTAQQTLYADQLQRYAGADVALADTSLVTPPPTGLPNPPPVPQPDKPGSSLNVPVVVPQDSSEQDQLRIINEAERLSASQNNRIVYVKAPDGVVYEIQAGQ